MLPLHDFFFFPPTNMCLSSFRATPWYKPEATGLRKMADQFLVTIGYYNEMPSAASQSEGYRLEEMGPQKVKHCDFWDCLLLFAR